jgi:hypothetical protein
VKSQCHFDLHFFYDPFFMYLLTICTFSSENSLFSSFAHLFNGLLILCGISLFEPPEYSGY